MEKIYIDWETVGIMIDELVNKVNSSDMEFDGVYGIPRGGLPLAVALSHNLNLPLLVHPTKNSLVCDDISDTGVTLSNIKHKMIVCLYTSKWTKVIPYHFVRVKEDKNSWIVFPWEDRENEN